jgi:ATP-dependent Clp protease ATP-binding subunit ClpA
VGLCAGPSGVGKTLTAELLAEYWFGNQNAITKIPCEAYSESHGIAKLIGSPPGYVGHWDPNNPKESGTPPILYQGNIEKFALDSDPKLKKLEGAYNALMNELAGINAKLIKEFSEVGKFCDNSGAVLARDLPSMTEKLKEAKAVIVRRDEIIVLLKRLEHQYGFDIPKRPKSIILFDEIEKASPTLHNILLNIMDKGQLQLANGMITDFSNSVILMTTNVGSRQIAEMLNPKDSIGFTGEVTRKSSSTLDKEIYKKTIEELKKVFAPELLARFDRISVYRPLGPEILRDIVDVELRKFQDKILDNFPITIRFADSVKKLIFSEATDKPENGARLVRNKVYKYLRKPFCRLKNKAQIQKYDVVHVMLDEKKRIVFEREEDIPEEKKD